MSGDPLILIEISDHTSPVWTIADLDLDDDPPDNFDANYIADLPHLPELIENRTYREATITVSRPNPAYLGPDSFPGIDPPPRYIDTTATVNL